MFLGGLPVFGTRSINILFNLPQSITPHMRGIFTHLLLDAGGIAASTPSNKTPIALGPVSTGYIYMGNRVVHGFCRPRRRNPALIPDITFEVGVQTHLPF